MHWYIKYCDRHTNLVSKWNRTSYSHASWYKPWVHHEDLDSLVSTYRDGTASPWNRTYHIIETDEPIDIIGLQQLHPEYFI